jgi:hypothetical protein
MKKITIISVCFFIISIASGMFTAAASLIPTEDDDSLVFDYVAEPTTYSVYVNDKNIAFDAYSIAGNNYFKLRDLAFVLSGTEKQFEVQWNPETGNIILIKDRPYTPVGGEMVSKGDDFKQTFAVNLTMLCNSNNETDETIPIELMAFNIQNNNYFKLRDIGALFNFGVEWEDETNRILIDTNKNYLD